LQEAFLAAVTFGVAQSAHSHTGVAEAGGVLSGLLHPPSGWDHILALLAVGVWATRSDARMAILGAFNLMLVCGAGAAMRGVALPIVESGIAASLLVLGLLIALAVRLPRIAATAIVCVFAVVHGHPHAAEIAAIVNPLGYALGSIAASIALNACGLLLGSWFANSRWLRAAGAAFAVIGGGMLAAS
jgi:urease accessory protein